VQWIFNISNFKWSLICCTACRIEGLGPIQDAEADSAIISALTSAKDEVKEEVVDALCALSSHENMRSRIVQKVLYSL
jgi:HEAT repeat protein